MIGVGDASRELAGLFAGGLKDESIKLLRGVVESVVGGRVFLYLSGDNTYAVGPFVVLDTGYGPTPGDVVWVLKNGPDYLVIGRHASGGPSDIASRLAAVEALAGSGREIAQATGTIQVGPSQGAVLITTTAGGHVFRGDRWYHASVRLVGSAQLAGTGWNFTLRTTGGTTLPGTTTYIHRPNDTSSRSIQIEYDFVGLGSAHGVRCQWNQRDGNNSTFTSYGNSVTSTLMISRY